jgi:hypothetical protein
VFSLIPIPSKTKRTTGLCLISVIKITPSESKIKF